jgi:single-stranded DNA-binding protein
MRTSFKAQIIGNVGANSTIKILENGDKYLAFNVAHNEKYYDKKLKQEIEQTQWISCLFKLRNDNDKPDLSIESGTVVSIEGKVSYKIYMKEDNKNGKKVEEPIVSVNLLVLDLNIIGKIEKRK